ncbi:MAG: type II secretion system protein GspG [Candidatus Sumerlaeaceae bacterium]|nr:type II secretion system protein GspG [Candidatus Sumerlaeaceae bacterium]
MKTRRAFTLIELLIVVAIIAILAAIAVPNFLESQIRAKVARSRADIRSIATAVESYRVDYNHYPEGTDNPAKYPEEIGTFLGPLASGYYTFRTRDGLTQTVGRDFASVTTPIAYISSIPTDPFAKQAAGFLTYSYRNAKNRKNGWVITSVGPDVDILAANGKGSTNAGNPISTAADTKTPSRIGDINETEVINFLEAVPTAPSTLADVGKLPEFLLDLSYDPTNGSVSDGDIVRVGP